MFFFLGGLGGCAPQGLSFVSPSRLSCRTEATDGPDGVFPPLHAHVRSLFVLAQVVHNCSRFHKYALGADLRDGARRALTLVVLANARRDKAPGLLQRRQEREKRQVLRRPGQDVKACPTGQSLQHAST